MLSNTSLFVAPVSEQDVVRGRGVPAEQAVVRVVTPEHDVVRDAAPERVVVRRVPPEQVVVQHAVEHVVVRGVTSKIPAVLPGVLRVQRGKGRIPVLLNDVAPVGGGPFDVANSLALFAGQRFLTIEARSTQYCVDAEHFVVRGALLLLSRGQVLPLVDVPLVVDAVFLAVVQPSRGPLLRLRGQLQRPLQGHVARPELPVVLPPVAWPTAAPARPAAATIAGSRSLPRAPGGTSAGRVAHCCACAASCSDHCRVT
jgi:hypothetical protein